MTILQAAILLKALNINSLHAGNKGGVPPRKGDRKLPPEPMNQ
jgi:hypothetical protein